MNAWFIRSSALAVFVVALAIPALADDPIHISKEEALRAATNRTDPEYSIVAKQLKLEGEVKVEVSINEEGVVDDVTSVSGNPVLFQCVKTAVKHWKFAPFKADGKPAKALAALSFAFKM